MLICDTKPYSGLHTSDEKPFTVCIAPDFICFDIAEITSEYNALSFDCSSTTIS